MFEVGHSQEIKCLITGVSGFIGQALAHTLKNDSIVLVTGTYRNNKPDSPSVSFPVRDINAGTCWSSALRDVDVVVHLAGRAHVLYGNNIDALAEFRRVNVDGTLALARQSIVANVKRFIFISSIGVNGSGTAGAAFSEDTFPEPHAEYAVSKYEAELALQRLFKDTNVELVIIRPPLVYAAHAPGNFARLMRLVASGLPLPFGLVHNQRSMIALENLVDFIALCISHPAASDQTFLISDGVDVSTPHIMEMLAQGMDKKVRFIPLPVGLLRFGASALGKLSIFQQLCGSLVIDSTKANKLLGWQPPLEPNEALMKAGRDYRKRH